MADDRTTDELARALDARADGSQLTGDLLAARPDGEPGDWDARSSQYAAAPFYADAALDRAAAARLRDLEAALAWVSEVHPDTLPNGGAVVEMTWDEFNVMRAVLGKNPLKPAPALCALTGGGHG